MSFFDLGKKEDKESSEQPEKPEQNLHNGELEKGYEINKENKEKEEEEEIKKDPRDERPENKEKKFQFLIPEEKYNKMKSSIKNAIKGFMNKLDQKKEDLINKKTFAFEKKAKEASDETDQHNKIGEDGKIEKPFWKFWGGKRRKTMRKKKGRKKKTKQRKTHKRKQRKTHKRKHRTRRKRNRKTKKRNTARGVDCNFDVGDIVSFRHLMGSKKQKPGEIVEIDNKTRTVRVKHKMYSSTNDYTMSETDFIPCGRVKLATKEFIDHWDRD